MRPTPKSATQRTRSAHVVRLAGQEEDISVPKVLSDDDENEQLRVRAKQLEDLLRAILLFP